MNIAHMAQSYVDLHRKFAALTTFQKGLPTDPSHLLGISVQIGWGGSADPEANAHMARFLQIHLQNNFHAYLTQQIHALSFALQEQSKALKDALAQNPEPSPHAEP